jgi:hypothetical protein
LTNDKSEIVTWIFQVTTFLPKSCSPIRCPTVHSLACSCIPPFRTVYQDNSSRQFIKPIQNLGYRYSDCGTKYAMSGRNFGPAGFGAIGALTVDHLLTIFRGHPEHVLHRLGEELDSLRAEQVRALVSTCVLRSSATC